MFLRDNLAVPEDLVGRLVIQCPTGHSLPGPEQRIDLVTAANARSLTTIPAFPYTGNVLYHLRYELRRGEEWVTATEYLLPRTIAVGSEESLS